MPRTVSATLMLALIFAPFSALSQGSVYWQPRPLYPHRAVAPAPVEPTVNASGDVIEIEPAEVVDTVKDEPETGYLTGLQEEAKWGGTVEAGLRYTTGNTESRHFNAAGTVSRDSEHWKNTLKGRFGRNEEDGKRTKEEYRASLNSRYKLTRRSFLFGEGQYIYDRDSGYDYRINEVLGAGYHWYDSKQFRWTSSAGAGYQHAKSEDGSREDSPMARIENELFWQVLERVGFEQLARMDISDFTTTYTESSLKTEVSDGLYVKFSLITEHLSDVPPGTDKLDIETLINLAYEY